MISLGRTGGSVVLAMLLSSATALAGPFDFELVPIGDYLSLMVSDGPVTFAFGDGSADFDAPVEIRAFSADDILLGTLSSPTDGSLGGTLSGQFAGASYFLVGSGSLSGNDNSLLWAVVDYSTVPEPGSLALLATGLGLRAFQRRKSRARAEGTRSQG